MITKKFLTAWILTFILLANSVSVVFADTAAPSERFSDVPQGHWAETQIQKLRDLGITAGIGNNQYGLANDILRYEFVIYLVKLMKWEVEPVVTSSFTDVLADESFCPYVETAKQHGLLNAGETLFRPRDPITKEEMAVMIVRTLGYDQLANAYPDLKPKFPDVTEYAGYIRLANQMGIISGAVDGTFRQKDKATRAQAAVMMINMYDRLHHPIDELHAFYAIQSFPQVDKLQQLQSVSFGWSRMEVDNSGNVLLNTTTANNNEYYIPTGFASPVQKAIDSQCSIQLMVQLKSGSVTLNDQKTSLANLILTDPEKRKNAIDLIVNQLNTSYQGFGQSPFSGVVIDFEGMQGAALRDGFNLFLTELRQMLDESKKSLWVAVHPVREAKYGYFDAYDYKTIGQLADKVVLMAHDYDAKQLTAADMAAGITFTPLAPINDVYYALQAALDPVNGIGEANKQKLMLQISFGSAVWSLKDGKVTAAIPVRPTYADINNRLLDANTQKGYSTATESPFATYTLDGSDKVLWYEDSRSVEAKIKLAEMMGISSFSLWRLGNIPDYQDSETQINYLDVWQKIIAPR